MTSTINDSNGRRTLLTLAHPHAARAHDAALHISDDCRVCQALLNLSLLLLEPSLCRAVFFNKILEIALACLIAVWTIERMIDQQKLKNAAPHISDLLCLGPDNHAVNHHKRAGSLKPRHLFDFNKTESAAAIPLELFVKTERWYFDTCRARCLKDRHRLFELYFFPFIVTVIIFIRSPCIFLP